MWRRPAKRDLVVGNTVEVKNGRGIIEGTAKLVKRSPSRYVQDNLPKVEFVKKNDKQNDTMYLYSSERWTVEWVNHTYYRPGDKNCREVYYFVTKSTDYPSFVEMNFVTYQIGGRGVPLTGHYIFLEEEGVLTIDGENYLPEAVKALKRLKRGFNGEVVVYTNNPLQVKDRWEINKIGFRIYDFLHNDISFEKAISNFLEEHEVEDHAILSGVSNVPKGEKKKNRVIQTDPEVGLKLKQRKKKENAEDNQVSTPSPV